MKRLLRSLKMRESTHGPLPEVPKKIWASTVGNKGGSAKSFNTALTAAALGADGKKVSIIDFDGGNATTFAITPDAQFVDLRSKTRDALGLIIMTTEAMEDGHIDHVAIDIGAGDTRKFLAELLPKTLDYVDFVGGRLVFCCAINDEADTHADAIDHAMLAFQNKIGCLFMVSYGQGIDEDGLYTWYNSKDRENALENGAVEIRIDDLTRAFSTISRNAKLSLINIVNQDFSNVPPEQLKDVTEYFDLNRQCFIADFLADHIERVRIGLAQAVHNASLIL